MSRCPPLVKDIYYDAENLILPYTEAAAAYKKKTYRGSVANMTLVFLKYRYIVQINVCKLICKEIISNLIFVY